MLKEIKINNYALIDSIEMSFNSGMTSITGETGAGKSILVGGLSLVLGSRVDNSKIINKQTKCFVEATFDINEYDLNSFFDINSLDYEKETILRREVIPSGKSRAFINDTPVNLDVLSKLGNTLIDIHSQHNNLTLLDNNFKYLILDSLSNNSYLQVINKKHSSILGRDKDPKLPTDISKTKLWIRKANWTIATIPGLRLLTKFIYPKSTISHFNVQNAVAFTIDDGFCGADNKDGCMIEEVRKLFKIYNAHATFFIAGSHCNNVSIGDVNSLIDDGHEIANHNMMDWSYKNYTTDEFEFDLHLTKYILSLYKQEYSSWYRAPFGILTKEMQTVIERENLIHVVSDAFANDTYIPDPNWISKYILNRVKNYKCELSGLQRFEILQKSIRSIQKNKKVLSELISLESGLCIKNSLYEVERAINCIHYCAVQAKLIDNIDFFLHPKIKNLLPIIYL